MSQEKDLLVASNAVLPARLVLEEVVLRLQKVFDLGSLCVELQPLLVDGLGDPVDANAGRLQPVSDTLNCMFGGCKKICDLLRSVVFAVRRGRRVGPDIESARSRGRRGRGILHLHEKLITAVEVALRQANAHG